jgi:hypothetical protein
MNVANFHPFRWLAALAVLVLPAIASATPTYSFSTDQSTYTAAPGQVVPVQVYLNETLGDGDASLLNAYGLLGAGVMAQEQSVTSDAPAVLDATDIMPGTGFDGGSVPTPSPNASLYEYPDFSSPAVTGTLSGNVANVYLGTFDFTAGQTPGTDMYLLTTRAPDSQDFVANDPSFTVLDPEIQSMPFAIQVVAAPEPAGIALLALPLIWSSRRAGRRRYR